MFKISASRSVSLEISYRCRATSEFSAFFLGLATGSDAAKSNTKRVVVIVGDGATLFVCDRKSEAPKTGCIYDLVEMTAPKWPSIMQIAVWDKISYDEGARRVRDDSFQQWVTSE